MVDEPSKEEVEIVWFTQSSCEPLNQIYNASDRAAHYAQQ